MDTNKAKRHIKYDTKVWLCLLLLTILGVGCASTQVNDHQSPTVYTEASTGILGNGTKPVVAVLPLALGLTTDGIKKYPHLVEKSVGLGVYQLVLSTVTNSKHYIVTEIRPEHLDAIIREHWLRGSGLMSNKKASEGLHQLGAELVIYGRVYDYAETVSENIIGLKSKRDVKIMVGVQLICTDVASLREVGLGTAVGYGDSLIEATRTAVKKATDILVCRLVRGNQQP